MSSPNSTKMSPLVLAFSLGLIGLAELPKAQAQASCAALFVRPAANRYESERAAWTQSQLGIESVRRQVFGMDNVVRSVLTAVVAKEFVWMNGDPGGAKTFISRMIFESVLRTVPDKEKRIFVLQFHKLIAEGKITGFPKFNEIMRTGRYEVETSTSLVGDQFLFLIADEAEKANPATLNALLSVLNERKAFLGSRVVDAALSSGVFTSNKTTGEFIQGFGDDRPSGEAFLDRNPIKIHVTNQFASAAQSAEYLIRLRNSRRERVDLPLMELSTLAQKVQISDEMMTDIVQITRSFDSYVTSKADDSRKAVRFGEKTIEYFPANQFSNRSARRMVQVFKSAFIIEQLWNGVPFDKIRTKIERKDLNLLVAGAAFGGPSRISHKSYALGKTENSQFKAHEIVAEDQYGGVVKLIANWNPWMRSLTLASAKDGRLLVEMVVTKDGEFIVKQQIESLELDAAQKKQIVAWMTDAETTNSVQFDKPQFEVDQSLADLLKRETLPARTREELESIKEDLEEFTQRLNQQVDRPAVKIAKGSGTRETGVTRSEVRNLRRGSVTPGRLDLRTSYDTTRRGAVALTQRFPELSHSIEAHFTGLLAREHLFVFGPPGGAKTALAESILGAELRTMNSQEANRFTERVIQSLGENTDGRIFLKSIIEEMRYKSPQKYKRFMLQFHKLVPEGVLTGFVKVEQQLEAGREEREFADSMAGKDFIFSILDEVDKANPQTLTALLSLLNEREVMAGNEVVKAALQTAIMTSNKMTSEILESFYEDRANAEALMDRALNKLFVANKFSTDEQLTQFLIDLEAGRSPEWRGVLALNDLRPLVNQVKINDYVVHLLESIREKFMAQRLVESEKSRRANLEDPRAYPDYYVPAATMSNRTAGKLQEQLKSRLIVSQLMEGVPFEKLRFEVDIQDLHLFFEGMGYWAPQSLKSSYDAHGIIEFSVEQKIMQALSENPQVPSRVRYHVGKMMEEGTDMVEVLNSEVRKFVITYREVIAKYPNLFPSLFRAGTR